jgi:hypothetical protein
MRTVELMALLGDRLRREPANAAAQKCVVDLLAQVATFTTPPQPFEVQIEILDDVLSLPVWQRRHELYAVWVASLITRTLGPLGVDFHCPGGVLSFPFKATHLASIGDPPAARPELWSELRTPAVEPTGKRVSSVQPDYRLRRPPECADGGSVAADVLVIECKQYRRSSTRNFADALTDYGKASATAEILLSNYGPVSPRVRAAIAPEVVERCHPIGQVHPGGAGLAEAQQVISRAAGVLFGVDRPPRWLMDSITIELRWVGEGVDLDLFVTTPDGACGYDSPNGLPDAVFDCDNRGNGTAQHTEKLKLSPTRSDRYEVIVRVYSGASDLRGLEAEVFISWRDVSNREGQRIISLFSAAARDWHVATLGVGLAEPVEVSKPAIGFASGRGWSPSG